MRQVTAECRGAVCAFQEAHRRYRELSVETDAGAHSIIAYYGITGNFPHLPR
ncbi:MAG TPA: hypothetical protein VJT49_20910 [Amycolatopsis sp.]|nr:hypothetical protein [Amycolatopsis sp.]